LNKACLAAAGFLAAICIALSLPAALARDHAVLTDPDLCKALDRSAVGISAEQDIALADSAMEEAGLNPLAEDLKAQFPTGLDAETALCPAMLYLMHFDAPEVSDRLDDLFWSGINLVLASRTWPEPYSRPIAGDLFETSQSDSLERPYARGALWMSIVLTGTFPTRTPEETAQKAVALFHRCTEFYLSFGPIAPAGSGEGGETGDDPLSKTCSGQREFIAQTLRSPAPKAQTKLVLRASMVWISFDQVFMTGAPVKDGLAPDLDLEATWHGLTRDALDEVPQDQRAGYVLTHAQLDAQLARVMAALYPAALDAVGADLTAAAHIAREAGWVEAAEILESAEF